VRILPPRLAPWRIAIERRHRPPSSQGRYGYRSYRQCLRWEFGFTCPFCLCHESDFAPRGAEGLGVTQIEHFLPVSNGAESTNDYVNCFYICRYCNRDRSTAPTIDPKDGRRLLNPCADVWEEHFRPEGDTLEPKVENSDASYTHAVYDLDDPRKVELRRFRRETIEECLRLIEHGQKVLDRLLERALQTREAMLIDEAKIIEDALRRAWQELESFKVVPRDARSSCPCDEEELYEVPQALQQQTLAVEPIAC
jgi:hypothetical protein